MHSGEIDWRAITEKDEHQKLYNKYLLKLTTKDMTYDNFLQGSSASWTGNCNCY
jgi:hypothetical protein